MQLLDKYPVACQKVQPSVCLATGLSDSGKCSPPKSEAGRRTIILGEGALQVLRGHIAILQAERQAAGDRWRENDLVFPSKLGSPWHQRNVLKHYKRFLQQAGLPNVHFHDLRHSCATFLLQQGVSPKVVQEILGHADITLTLNTYSHVTTTMQKEAAAKVDELLTSIDVTEAMKKVQKEQDLDAHEGGDTGKLEPFPRANSSPARDG